MDTSKVPPIEKPNGVNNGKQEKPIPTPPEKKSKDDSFDNILNQEIKKLKKEAYIMPSIYDFMDESCVLNEGSYTRSQKEFFNRTNKECRKDLKKAQALYIDGKYDEAKKLYTDSLKVLESSRDKIKSIESDNFIEIFGDSFYMYMIGWIKDIIASFKADSVAVKSIKLNQKELSFSEKIADNLKRNKSINKAAKVTASDSDNWATAELNGVSHYIYLYEYLINICKEQISNCDKKKNLKEETNMSNLWSFMEDSSELMPQEEKPEVDYKMEEEPIEGDPSEDLPKEEQPDYVPDGYEQNKPENDTDDVEESALDFDLI